MILKTVLIVFFLRPIKFNKGTKITSTLYILKINLLKVIEKTRLFILYFSNILTGSWCFDEVGEDSFSGKQSFVVVGDSYKK